MHNIVVVKPAQGGPSVEKDPDILRLQVSITFYFVTTIYNYSNKLQSIPMFLPIMRATLNLPAARDPEVLERLNPAPLHKFCSRYQSHLTACANLVATEQNLLTQKVREVNTST